MKSHKLEILKELVNMPTVALRIRVAVLSGTNPRKDMTRGSLILYILKNEYHITEFIGWDDEETADEN